MKRKGTGRGGRKVTVAPTSSEALSSNTATTTTNKKSIGFVQEATRQSGAGALPVMEKAIPISSIKVTSLPTSLRRHHEVCRFTQSLFRSGCNDDDDNQGGEEVHRSLIAVPTSTTATTGDEGGVVGGVSSSEIHHHHHHQVPLWTVSSHLQQEQYLAMSAALDVAVSAHMNNCKRNNGGAGALSPAAVLLLKEASAVFCAALPMMKSASLDLSTLSGLRQALDLFMVLIVPCRSWGGHSDNSSSNWLAWGLTFSRLGRSHTHLPQEAAQTAATCIDGSSPGWLIQSAQLWSKSLTSIEAANGAFKQATKYYHSTTTSQNVASPMLDRAWLDVPVGGLSGSPHVDKWRVEEAAAAAQTTPSSSCQSYTPLVVSAATFHSTLHAVSSKNIRPTTNTSSSSSLSSCFTSLVDVVHNGHEPSSKYLSGLLRKVSSMIRSNTPSSPTTSPSIAKKVADPNFLQSASESVLLLSSNAAVSRQAPSLPTSVPVVGIKRERDDGEAAASPSAVKVEADGDDVISGSKKVAVPSGCPEWSRRELMGRLVLAMQEGEGIPPYMRYLQRLSKDATNTATTSPSSSLHFDAESIFPTLGDLPSTVVAPSLWSTSPDVLRGYGGKIQLEIHEEFLANIKPPPSYSKVGGGGGPWIFPFVMWALDGSVMAVLLRRWMVGSPGSTNDDDDALAKLSTHICNNVLRKTNDTSSSSLSVAVASRLLRGDVEDACCCSVVVDHTLLHLLQPPSHDAVFAGLVEGAACLEGRDVVGRVGEASHGLLVWCYGGFEGMGASIGHFPACSFKC